jgi:hypothetical protein
MTRRKENGRDTMSKAVYNVTINVTVNGTADDVAQSVADAVKRELTKMSAQEFVSYASDLLGLGDKRIKSPQEIRDEIVERAKADVAELERIGRSTWDDLPAKSPFFERYYRVKFYVNRDKRAVTAVVHGYNKGEKSVGVAKCAPGDVFNAHIGRAIALRRALGLPVPDEYLNAPQPTEVRVGDVVVGIDSIHAGISGIVESVGDPSFIDGENGLVFRNEAHEKARGYARCWTYREQVKVIDDSREETEVSA